MQRHLYHHGAHKQFVSKNPLFTNKMRALIDVFPDARFMVLQRAPHQAVPSSLSMWHFVWHNTGTLAPGQLDVERCLDWCHGLYAHPLKVAKEAPGQVAFVEYEHLKTDIHAAVSEAFGRLDLPIHPSLAHVLAKAAAPSPWSPVTPFDAS